MPDTSLHGAPERLLHSRPYSPGVRVEPAVPPSVGPTAAPVVEPTTPFGSALDACSPARASPCSKRSNVARMSSDGTHCPMKVATLCLPATANAAETTIDPSARPTSSDGGTRRT